MTLPAGLLSRFRRQQPHFLRPRRDVRLYVGKAGVEQREVPGCALQGADHCPPSPGMAHPAISVPAFAGVRLTRTSLQPATARVKTAPCHLSLRTGFYPRRRDTAPSLRASRPRRETRRRDSAGDVGQIMRWLSTECGSAWPGVVFWVRCRSSRRRGRRCRAAEFSCHWSAAVHHHQADRVRLPGAAGRAAPDSGVPPTAAR